MKATSLSLWGKNGLIREKKSEKEKIGGREREREWYRGSDRERWRGILFNNTFMSYITILFFIYSLNLMFLNFGRTRKLTNNRLPGNFGWFQKLGNKLFLYHFKFKGVSFSYIVAWCTVNVFQYILHRMYRKIYSIIYNITCNIAIRSYMQF